MKEDWEIVYKRSFGENCIVAVAVCYIFLGLLNFGSGIFSLILLGNIKDATCQYAVQMGKQCNTSGCTTPCGGPTFSSCGIAACDKLRCSADISAFLLLPDDTESAKAADCFSTLEGKLTVVQVSAQYFNPHSVSLDPSFHPLLSRDDSITQG